jgi:hypothetical protein
MNTENGWQINIAYASSNKFTKFSKKHSREYVSVFANLEKILGLLRSGNKIGGFQVGFFRSEGEGVYRIGQTGVSGSKESRLYVFPDEKNKTMYVLGIGVKDGQSDDIREAKTIAKAIKANIESTPAATTTTTTTITKN